MNHSRHSVRRGFTLIELTVAILMGVMICSMLMALFNQQLAFLRMYRTQSFLAEEAPIINNYVSRLIGRADRFRLHDNVSDALAGRNPRTTASPVVLLNFRQPDGTMRATILSFEQRSLGKGLYYYVVPAAGVLTDPQWAVSTKPSKVEFAMTQGILRMTLDGTAGEQITYSGSMQ